MKICTKYSGDKFWENILFHVNTGCPIITFPFSESLAIGDVTGCLRGNATPELTDLKLTPAASSTYGAVTYLFDAFQPVLAISFDFEITLPASENGADATFFWFNSNQDAFFEEDEISGYLVGFSEFNQQITIKYDADDLGSVSQTFHFGQTYHIDIIFNTGAFTVKVDSGTAITATDTNYNTRVQSGHNKFGLGARCGAVYAQHVASNLSLANVLA